MCLCLEDIFKEQMTNILITLREERLLITLRERSVRGAGLSLSDRTLLGSAQSCVGLFQSCAFLLAEGYRNLIRQQLVFTGPDLPTRGLCFSCLQEVNLFLRPTHLHPGMCGSRRACGDTSESLRQSERSCSSFGSDRSVTDTLADDLSDQIAQL